MQYILREPCIATMALLLSQNGLRSNLRASNFKKNFQGEHAYACTCIHVHIRHPCNPPSTNPGYGPAITLLYNLGQPVWWILVPDSQKQRNLLLTLKYVTGIVKVSIFSGVPLISNEQICSWWLLIWRWVWRLGSQLSSLICTCVWNYEMAYL